MTLFMVFEILSLLKGQGLSQRPGPPSDSLWDTCNKLAEIINLTPNGLTGIKLEQFIFFKPIFK